MIDQGASFKKLTKWLIWLGLLVTASLFVKKSIEDFINCGTTYSESHELISLKDLPTLTLCLELQDKYSLVYSYTQDVIFSPAAYGKELTIDAKVYGESKEKTVTLVENQSVGTHLTPLPVLIHALQPLSHFRLFAFKL